MTIRFATCARRRNGKIVGIGTVHRNSLGQDEHHYWPAARINEVQDTEEVVRYYDPTENQEKTLNLGLYQFIVQNVDGTRSVDIKAECEQDECHIVEPVTGDIDLVIGLQECPGDFPTSDE